MLQLQLQFQLRLEGHSTRIHDIASHCTQAWTVTDEDKYAKECRERYGRDYASLEDVTDRAP
jgi:hypothetical protein